MDFSEAEESSPPEKCHQRWVNKQRMLRHGHDGIKTVKVAVWGCHGDTVFSNKWECETHCVPLSNKDKDCSLPKESGPCWAYFPRWFWDNSSGQCKRFVYGGCGGNRNRFGSFEDCLKTCAKTDGFSQDYGIMIPPRGHQSPGMWDPRPRPRPPRPEHQWPDRWDQRLPTTPYWL